jgi:hypothetical protein
MSELRPWDIWKQNNPSPVPTPVIYPDPQNISEEVRDAKPWDLLNPNRPRATEEIEKERLDICKNCPSYRRFAKQCKECGCVMPAKVKLAEAFCPLGKWTAIDPE